MIVSHELERVEEEDEDQIARQKQQRDQQEEDDDQEERRRRRVELGRPRKTMKTPTGSQVLRDHHLLQINYSSD